MERSAISPLSRFLYEVKAGIYGQIARIAKALSSRDI